MPPAPPGSRADPIAAEGLTTSDLHKAFGDHPVLRGVDLTVPDGAFAAVLGASGSGKTTLLRILAGFERPDRGAVAIGGVTLDDDHHHVRAERRRIGYVPQEGSLFPHLTVEGNVGFGLRVREGREAEIAELLERVGLSGLGHRYPHQLSGGQQQRVALARALAVKPRIVLLDEPFASLDTGLRATVRADVRAAVQRSGATAVLVTHDQDEALSIADLVAVIRDGVVAQAASPRDLYESPVDPDLARFVGEANLIEGTSYGSTAETALGWLELRDGRRPARQPVTVLVRPEQLRVTPSPGGGPGVGARVVEAGFHGHDALVHLVTEDAASAPMIARVVGGMRLETGARVTIKVVGPVHCWPRPSAGDTSPDPPAGAQEGEPT
ncbi:MAG: ABC transporter ATP-binding protein [Candidatus Dormibacteria bacterium]